ncbi:MAG: hypothetical protein Q9174_003795, partial [Haloplaca sp. 1 TL-2023]
MNASPTVQPSVARKKAVRYGTTIITLNEEERIVIFQTTSLIYSMPFHVHEPGIPCVAGSQQARKLLEDHEKLQDFARLLHERQDVLNLATRNRDIPVDWTTAQKSEDKVNNVKKEVDMI